MTISLSLKKTRIALCVIAGMVVGFVSTTCLRENAVVCTLDMMFLLCIILTVGVDVTKMNASTLIRAIVLLGLFARLIVAILGTFGPVQYRMLFNEADQSTFIKIANQYFRGDFGSKSTRYPFVINYIFHIFGPYEIMVRISNIILWYLGFKVIYVAAGRRLRGKMAVLMSAFYCLLPMQIKLTAGAMRESIIALFIMITILFLYKWMINGSNFDLLLSVCTAIVATLFHTGCSAVLGVIFLTYVLWNKHTEKWSILSWKAAILFFAFLCVVPLYHLFLLVFSNFNYFPRELTIEALTSYPYLPGRSDYVIGDATAHNIIEFVWGTIYRCVYFWISPTPRFWNSPLDLVGFFGDSVPWACFFLLYIKKLKIKGGKTIGSVGLLLLVLYTFVYAWGTRNAGTAMRHRDALSGAFVLILSIMGADCDGRYGVDGANS